MLGVGAMAGTRARGEGHRSQGRLGCGPGLQAAGCVPMRSAAPVHDVLLAVRSTALTSNSGSPHSLTSFCIVWRVLPLQAGGAEEWGGLELCGHGHGHGRGRGRGPGCGAAQVVAGCAQQGTRLGDGSQAMISLRAAAATGLPACPPACLPG